MRRLKVNPKRVNRVEPRAVKRRPKEYDRLNQPREILRQRLIEKGEESQANGGK